MKRVNINISLLKIDAYDDVRALWQECTGVYLSDADSRGNLQIYLDRNPDMSFIATAEGKAVGAVLAGHDGRRGYIHHLVVHPDCRRQGIGGKLVQRCLDVLGAAGIQKSLILIFNDNSEGIAFWKSLGWTLRPDVCMASKVIGQVRGQA